MSKLSHTLSRPLQRRTLLSGASGLAAAAAAPTVLAAATQDPVTDVKGKSVLITGSSSGFGKLASLHLAREGARVIASMRNLDGGKHPEAQELADIASDEKLDLHVVDIDVLDPALIASGVAAAEEIAEGKLDVLVSNAGIALAGPIEMHDEEAAMLQLQTNLFGPQRMARAVLPAMRAQKQGYIIQISSQLGRMILPTVGMYSVSKFGVEAMFEAMAYELAPHGVDVTIIQPGGYPTKIWENGQRYTNTLISRTSQSMQQEYEPHLAITQGFLNGGGTTDPMDIPRAISALVSTPAGARPLRKPVHPRAERMKEANAVMAKLQANTLGAGPFAAWHKAVAE